MISVRSSSGPLAVSVCPSSWRWASHWPPIPVIRYASPQCHWEVCQRVPRGAHLIVIVIVIPRRIGCIMSLGTALPGDARYGRESAQPASRERTVQPVTVSALSVTTFPPGNLLQIRFMR